MLIMAKERAPMLWVAESFEYLTSRQGPNGQIHVATTEVPNLMWACMCLKRQICQVLNDINMTIIIFEILIE